MKKIALFLMFFVFLGTTITYARPCRIFRLPIDIGPVFEYQNVEKKLCKKKVERVQRANESGQCKFKPDARGNFGYDPCAYIIYEGKKILVQGSVESIKKWLATPEHGGE